MSSAIQQYTDHGRLRMQQRGIPPLIVQWLEAYGSEKFDHRGGCILHFDKRARRRLEREVGREPVRRMHEWMDAYIVVAMDGTVVTVGHRYERIWH